MKRRRAAMDFDQAVLFLKQAYQDVIDNKMKLVQTYCSKEEEDENDQVLKYSVWTLVKCKGNEQMSLQKTQGSAQQQFSELYRQKTFVGNNESVQRNDPKSFVQLENTSQKHVYIGNKKMHKKLKVENEFQTQWIKSSKTFLIQKSKETLNDVCFQAPLKDQTNSFDSKEVLEPRTMQLQKKPYDNFYLSDQQLDIEDAYFQMLINSL